MNIALILLVRNERPCLELMFEKIPKPGPASGFDLMVAVDGASDDGTVEFLGERGVKVIAQSRRGRGEAILQAIEQVEADACLFFSPDGNEAIADLSRFRPLLESGADIVIASRMMPEAHNEEDGKFLRPRKWANNIFNGLANCMFRHSGPYITDSINGFRAITKSAAQRLQLDAPDYTIEYQMTIRALHTGLNIVEFPTIEGARVAGETGAPSIPTGLRFVRRLWWEWKDKGVRQ